MTTQLIFALLSFTGLGVAVIWTAYRRKGRLDRRDALLYYLLAVGATWAAIVAVLIPNDAISTPYGIEVIGVASAICLVAGGAGFVVYRLLSTGLESNIKRWLNELGWKTQHFPEPDSHFTIRAENSLGYRIALTRKKSLSYIGLTSQIEIDPAYKSKLENMTPAERDSFFADLRVKMIEKGQLAFGVKPERPDVPSQIIPVDRIQLENVSQTTVMSSTKRLVDAVSIINAFFANRLGEQSVPVPGQIQGLVKIGKTEVHLGMVCRAYETPSPQEWLEYAKESVYFCGGSLPHFIQGSTEAVVRFIGEKKMRFLLLDPFSPIGRGRIITPEPQKKMDADATAAITNLRTYRTLKLPESRFDEMEILVHDQLPFNMALIDADSKDAPDSFIQIGYYSLGSVALDRPSVVVSKRQNPNVYEILLRHYNTIRDAAYDADPLKSPYFRSS